MDNLPECSAEQLGSRKEEIDARCRAAGVADGHPVVVLSDDGACLYRYAAQANAEAVTGDPIPDCSLDLCKKFWQNIVEVCHSKDWRPGTPVLIMQPDGKVCYCHCV